MKNIFDGWRSFFNESKMIKESSLSRVYRFIQKTDVAIITGFRDDPFDLSKCAPGVSLFVSEPENARKANMLRNRNLKAALLSLGYGVTKVRGTYIEDFETPQAVEVGENSLIVVNLEDDSNFINKIIMLGKKFCQDSVLIVPKGGKDAYLHGTNKSQFPGLDQKIKVGDLKMGDESEFMTRVGGRPFTFAEGLETYKSISRLERMAVKSLSKLVLD